MTKLRIVTRKSALALWQAHFVGAELKAIYPDLHIEVIGIHTQGDRLQDISLAGMGGKGLFVKELEDCVLQGQADIAVHSMKDMPAELMSDLCIGAILKRIDPRDVLVTEQSISLLDLAPGARIGTSSLRRQAQLLKLRPDLNIIPIRGNIDTRLQKLHLNSEKLDALVLAAAGLMRLDLLQRYPHEYLAMLPAVGQGALGIECRADDTATLNLISALNDPDSQTCLLAERSMNATLKGSCDAPIAGYAEIQHGELCVQGLVAEPDGSHIIQATVRGRPTDAYRLGVELGQALLDQGAAAILARLKAFY